MRHCDVTDTLCLSCVLLFFSVDSQSCTSGWFGSNCEYKCRCVDNRCDAHGRCTGSNKCQGGWFGPMCQYTDLVYNTTSLAGTLEVTDGLDSTCITPSGISNITIDMTEPIVFTWMRVVVTQLGSADLVNLSLSLYLGSTQIPCAETKRHLVDNATLDVQCNLTQRINHVILEGGSVDHLCSVYVSGECVVGSFGAGCNSSCSLNCKSPDDGTMTSCHHVTGKCLKGCKSGFVGPACEMECSVGSFGDGCNSSCSRNCQSPNNTTLSSCHHVNGECFKGCKAGYTGTTCKNVCDTGKYGNNCSKSCSKNCVKDKDPLISPCHHTTGLCIGGCNDDFTGGTCQSVAPSERADFSLEAIIGIVAGIMCVVGLCVARSKQKASSGEKGVGNVQPDTTPTPM